MDARARSSSASPRIPRCRPERASRSSRSPARGYSQLHSRSPIARSPSASLSQSSPRFSARSLSRPSSLRPSLRPSPRSSPRLPDFGLERAESDAVALRRRLARARSEAAALRRDLEATGRASAECAGQCRANRERVQELLDEEREANLQQDLSLMDSVFEQEVRDPHAALHEEVAAVRQETSELAEEVAVLAERQIARCTDLRELRARARLHSWRRRARHAQRGALDGARRCEAQSRHLAEATEAAEALRAQARHLRAQAAAARAEAAARRASHGKAFAAQSELQVLQAELRAEEHRSKIWQLIDASREHSQVALRSQLQELSASMQAVQDLSGRTAAELQDTESQEEALAQKLSRAQRKTAAMAEEARRLAAYQQSLEAELARVRDATESWRSARGAARQEAQRAANHCRRVLRSVGDDAKQEEPEEHVPLPLASLAFLAPL
ncbi:unnamed protein product [Effrenium voratum]|nr:unnamed protein product [Effrenium voratum]